MLIHKLNSIFILLYSYYLCCWNNTDNQLHIWPISFCLDNKTKALFSSDNLLFLIIVDTLSIFVNSQNLSNRHLKIFFENTHKKRCFEHLGKQPWGRTFPTSDLLLYLVSFLNPYFCISNLLICSDNMVYISPMHVVDTRSMFLRWCIVIRVWQLIRKCASLH